MNERLLIAGLREQTLADQPRHQLAFTAAITTSMCKMAALALRGRRHGWVATP